MIPAVRLINTAGKFQPPFFYFHSVYIRAVTPEFVPKEELIVRSDGVVLTRPYTPHFRYPIIDRQNFEPVIINMNQELGI